MPNTQIVGRNEMRMINILSAGDQGGKLIQEITIKYSFLMCLIGNIDSVLWRAIYPCIFLYISPYNPVVTFRTGIVNLEFVVTENTLSTGCPFEKIMRPRGG